MLPDRIHLEVRREDVDNAICGSPTQCTLANTIRRTYDGKATFVRVNPNRITISIHGYRHNYTMPNKGLKIVGLTDDGRLHFDPKADNKLTLRLIERPVKIPVPSEERRKRINAARKRRAENGTPDKSYPRNMRLLAAQRAGVPYARQADVRSSHS